MSELIQNNDNRATIRWKLLTGVSALALTAYISSANVAKAEDTDRPLIWVELGGQMEQVQGLTTLFTAPFMSVVPANTQPLVNPQAQPYPDGIFTDNQRPPRFAFGLEGEISFQPEDSDWILSGGIRYGRSHANRHVHHQSPAPTVTYLGSPVHWYLNAAPFVDVEGLSSERHMVLDFAAGKDVGLGAFGHDGVSTISVGVRTVEDSLDSYVAISARPSISYTHVYGKAGPRPEFNQYSLTAHTEHKFNGAGPSLAWNASAPIAGNAEHGELSLDWGINGAVLFGRQRTKVNHHTQGRRLDQHHFCTYTSSGICYGFKAGYGDLYPAKGNSRTRSRRVTVPNIGGFAALTAQFKDAKVSIGYRYDTFLNATDTGIDAVKNSNLTFNGPYASISIGLGD